MPAALDRLKKRSEFLAVAAANRRWTTPGLVLQARPYLTTELENAGMPCADDAQGTGGLRVGFTATKKVGNAVKRNRARRRLRAAVADVLKGSQPAHADIVVVARQGTIERPYAELRSDLEAAMRKLRIVR